MLKVETVEKLIKPMIERLIDVVNTKMSNKIIYYDILNVG